jgi:hypothetical protein
MKKRLLGLVLLAAAGCGGGSSGGSSSASTASVNSNQTPAPTGTAPTTTQATTAAPVSATLALNQFAAFRETASIADLQPGSPGLAKKLFALEDKGFVRVLDLSGAKPVLDRAIQLDPAGPFPQGAAAGSLSIVDDHTAVVTESGNEAVYVFDPSTAQTASDVTKIDLTGTAVSFNTPQVNSVGQPVASPMTLSFTASAIVSQGKLFIASSNLDASFNLNPGTVVAFDMNPVTKALSGGSLIVTSCFDPTRLTRWTAAGSEALLCVNAGNNGKSPSSVDVIDPKTATLLTSVQLGQVSAFGAVAITPDGKHGYIGSQSAAEVYELDLSQFGSPKLVGTIALPAAAGLNFIAGIGVSQSGSYVYATNFNSSTLSIIDVAARKCVGSVAGFQRNGDPTQFQCNASALAVRPGVPGVDFTGPPVFVATIGLDAADRTIANVVVALDGASFDRN